MTTLTKFLRVLTILALSALPLSAQYNNVFNFTFFDSGDNAAGRGTLTFTTADTTGTFELSALSDLVFDVDITLSDYETDGPLRFSNIGEGETITLSGLLGSRTVSFNDPTGSNTQFNGYGTASGFFMYHNDLDLLFDFNAGAGYANDIQWSAVDATSAVPEPSTYALWLGLGCAALLWWKRRHRSTSLETVPVNARA